MASQWAINQHPSVSVIGAFAMAEIGSLERRAIVKRKRSRDEGVTLTSTRLLASVMKRQLFVLSSAPRMMTRVDPDFKLPPRRTRNGRNSQTRFEDSRSETA